MRVEPTNFCSNSTKSVALPTELHRQLEKKHIHLSIGFKHNKLFFRLMVLSGTYGFLVNVFTIDSISYHLRINFLLTLLDEAANAAEKTLTA